MANRVGHFSQWQAGGQFFFCSTCINLAQQENKKQTCAGSTLHDCPRESYHTRAHPSYNEGNLDGSTRPHSNDPRTPCSTTSGSSLRDADRRALSTKRRNTLIVCGGQIKIAVLFCTAVCKTQKPNNKRKPSDILKIFFVLFLILLYALFSYPGSFFSVLFFTQKY